MANNLIQLKRSSVPGRVPTTENLTTGEIAVNLSDKIMYSSDGAGVFEIGANNTNIQVSGNAVIHAIIANNSVGLPGQILATDGEKIYWTTFSTDISFVNLRYYGDNQTTRFEVPGGYTVGSLGVYINGIKSGGEDVDVSSGNYIVFSTPPYIDSEIDISGLKVGFTTTPIEEANIKLVRNNKKVKS
jgi:hypothetical protein